MVIDKASSVIMLPHFFAGATRLCGSNGRITEPVSVN